jgi:hypothetical protein
LFELFVESYSAVCFIQEEAYLREAIKASLEDEKVRKEKGVSGGEQKISSEGTDLLIDFMDDFASTG